MAMRLVLLVLVSLLSFNAHAECATYWNPEALGSTQVDSLALYNLQGRPVAHLTTAHLRQLVDIKNRLGFAANMKARLWLCDDPSLNAFAIPDARIIVFHLAYLDFLQWNPDAIAGVMAHEIAHVALGHSKAKQGKEALAALESLSAAGRDGAGPAPAGGLPPIPLSEDTRKTLFQLLFLKFNRDKEQQADDEGIKLMTRAGFNPEGATKAQTALLQRYGNRGGGYYDTHPSLKERVEKSRSYLTRSNAARALVAQIRLQAANDEEYARMAAELVAKSAWTKLGSLTRQWLAQSGNDENATALYYRGLYLGANPNQAALARRTFYRVVEIDPNNARARLELCVALFREGQKLESAYCQRNIDSPELKQEFQARTFGEYLWIGGEIEPYTSVVATRDEDGRKYVTNLQFAKQRGLEIANRWAE